MVYLKVLGALGLILLGAIVVVCIVALLAKASNKKYFWRLYTAAYVLASFQYAVYFDQHNTSIYPDGSLSALLVNTSTGFALTTVVFAVGAVVLCLVRSYMHPRKPANSHHHTTA